MRDMPVCCAMESGNADLRVVLSVRDLATEFRTELGTGRAVNGLSFEIHAGETLGIVGESGCGKSVAALSILGLIPSPPGRVVAGSAEFEGTDLFTMSDAEIRDVRGNEISMIFQEPMTALNPVLTAGFQIAESVRRHEQTSRRIAYKRAVEMLDLVRIPEPDKRAGEYPHQLSGGMRQRVMIAMALACNPKLLIADEPTTALDVTIQAQVLELIGDLQKSLGTAVILITHDLGVVAETADRVVVMYAGKKIEEAPVDQLFGTPMHPYTRGLMASVPYLDSDNDDVGFRKLNEIPGIVPALTELPIGCAFSPRCQQADDKCRGQAPLLESYVQTTHHTACWHAETAR